MTDLDRLDALTAIAANDWDDSTHVKSITFGDLRLLLAAARERDELRDLLLVTAHDMHDYAIVAEDPLHPALTWNICTDDRCAALRAALYHEDGA